jgi:hypothetical protein
MFLVEDGRPSSKTSLSTCRKNRYNSRSDTTTIMPDRRRPPVIAAQQRARSSGTLQGGNLAQEVVRRAPTRLAAIVVADATCNTGARHPLATSMTVAALNAHALLPGDHFAQYSAQMIALNPQVQRYALDVNRNRSNRETVRILASLLTGALRAEQDYRLPVPALLIHGQLDHLGDIALSTRSWPHREPWPSTRSSPPPDTRATSTTPRRSPRRCWHSLTGCSRRTGRGRHHRRSGARNSADGEDGSHVGTEPDEEHLGTTAIAAHWIGRLHRDLLSHLLLTGRRHPAAVLREFVEHYHTHRPHRPLDQHPPAIRPPPNRCDPPAPTREETGTGPCCTSTCTSISHPLSALTAGSGRHRARGPAWCRRCSSAAVRSDASPHGARMRADAMRVTRAWSSTKRFTGWSRARGQGDLGGGGEQGVECRVDCGQPVSPMGHRGVGCGWAFR